MRYRIKTGPPDVDPSDPSHIDGVRQGNQLGGYDRSPGHLPDGRSTAARSTGINPLRREPIDPSMPSLSPA